MVQVVTLTSRGWQDPGSGRHQSLWWHASSNKTSAEVKMNPTQLLLKLWMWTGIKGWLQMFDDSTSTPRFFFVAKCPAGVYTRAMRPRVCPRTSGRTVRTCDTRWGAGRDRDTGRGPRAETDPATSCPAGRRCYHRCRCHRLKHQLIKGCIGEHPSCLSFYPILIHLWYPAGVISIFTRITSTHSTKGPTMIWRHEVYPIFYLLI